MKILKSALLMILISISISYAQDGMPKDKSKFYSYGDNFIFDSFVQSADSEDSIRVNVFYKIAYEALVFNQTAFGFSSIYQVEFAFRDEQGIIRRRSNSIDTINVDSYDETKSKNKYSKGFVTVCLPISDFSVIIQVLDNKSQIFHRTSFELKKIKNFYKKATISSPMFTTKIKNNYHLYQLQNGIPFSSSPLTIFASAINSSGKLLKYVISKKEDKNQADWGEFSAVQGNAEIIDNSFIEFSKNEDIIATIANSNASKKSNLIKIDVSGNSFIPGIYQLIIESTSNKDTVEFKVVWENMPLSLNEPAYTLKTMEYILTDDEIKTFRSLSSRKLLPKIIEYWKKHDPTPNTPFNEAMAEYFRRVDYAFFNFQTINEKDGALSDRGMVYILYGKPDKVNTNVTEGKSKEIWHYSSLIKEFTFDLVSTGVYKLSDIKE